LTVRPRAPHVAAMSALPDPSDSPSLESVIVALCAAARPGRTVDPTEAARAYAKALGEDELGWRAHLQGVRKAAVRLAEAGRIVIYRKGKPIDPNDFRGVYRLGAPNVE
jgi:Protein of unknown function (DUF3253)